jgi:PAS domain S-box-containing protein
MEQLPNVLIVDDLIENLVLLEVIIAPIKLNLIKALSGAEALEKSRGKNLALAILDVWMPGMNGYELAIKLNEERADDKVPVIFLTATSMNDIEAKKGYGFGAVDYIFKPINDSILLNKIQVFLELFRQKQIILRETVLLKKSSDELLRVNDALIKSEEKYRSYIENAPDVVFVTDDSGRFTEMNKAGCQAVGYSKNDLLNMSISDLLNTESIRKGLVFLELKADSVIFTEDIKINQKNGSKVWWALEVVKLADSRFLGFAKNITHRMEMEEYLRSQQIEKEMQYEELLLAEDQAQDASERYAELYDFAPSGYFTLSSEKVILELNHSAALMLGKDRSQLIGSHLGFFISQKSLPVFNQLVLNVFKNKGKEICELTLELDNSQTKYVHIEGVVIRNSKQCLLNIIDITDRKKAEEDIRRANNFLDLVVENIPNMIFIKKANSLQFVRFNQAGEELLGIPSEELIGKSDYDFFTKEQADFFTENDRKVLLNKELIDIPEEIIHTRLRGRRILHTKKVPLINTQGEPEYLLGISEDITDRLMAQHNLKIGEEKYRTLLNASPDGILLIDMKGIIVEVSDIGLELFGAETRGNIVGKHFYRFIPSDQKTKILEIIQKTMVEGLAQNFELMIRKKNHALFAAEASATLIQGPSGVPLSSMIIVRDISHRKKMETIQFHADRIASLGEMASGIAHEINQPLNTISMVMDNILLEASRDENIKKEYLQRKTDKIFENITRIRNIIDHVRAFSRNHDDYIQTNFSINYSIENAISMVQEQFKHLLISLRLDLEDNLPLIIGNTFKFEQVILNLLSNSKDALLEKKKIKPSEDEMFISIRTYKEDRKIIVAMTDNGIGISQEDINYIMLPFYTTKDTGKGTGLGLSISYQIIKEMNGDIEVSSTYEEGTIFKITIDIN